VEHAQGAYYVPHGSHWPIVGSVGLGVLVVGIGMSFNGHTPMGQWIMAAGAAIMLYMIFGWFRTVIGESRSGLYNAQVDRSFRQGMGWFIFSEVMFFGAFFGALFYARVLAVPWLGGEGTGLSTNLFLWPEFEAAWPTGGPAALGGAFETIGAWGIPALNTSILLSSGVTITWAHWGLKQNNRRQLIWGLAATIALGLLFLGFQAYEYGHAFTGLEPDPGHGHLRLHVLHADRLPRPARDPRSDHADRDPAPNSLSGTLLEPGTALRIRGRGLVLALRRRRVADPVRVRVLAVGLRETRSACMPQRHRRWHPDRPERQDPRLRSRLLHQPDTVGARLARERLRCSATALVRRGRAQEPRGNLAAAAGAGSQSGT
jgi:cytochrome c oxidase subunit III